MVDSRDKGARAEAALKKYLRDVTKEDWQRVPGSGALGAVHKLKGDLYIVNRDNAFCVEVKHYAEDHISSKLLTGTHPQLIQWWGQACRQGVQVGKNPLLMFKFDRSKWFVAMGMNTPNNCNKILTFQYIDDTVDTMFNICLLEDWINSTKNITWTV
jgi:Holliday junction resolvase